VHRHTLATLLAPLALAATGCGHTTHTKLTSTEANANTRAGHLAFPLPTRSHLTPRAHELKGPRVMTAEHTHGRTLTMYGTAKAKNRILVAGCVNGTSCAGTDVVNADLMGCPPPDAELWHFATLKPDGADLDAAPDHPGAKAFRQATADLRPTTAIVFRTGTRPRVYAAGASAPQGRRFARIARLPFEATQSQGLAAWAATALQTTTAITVELPPGRASKLQATQIAYAIDRLAKTRFADGALDERRRMIAFGRDPRDSWH
jgi:hypothetical protein